MTARHRLALCAWAALALAAGGCSKKETKQKLPPASDWNAPVAMASGGAQTGAAGAPHAGAANPHAQMGQATGQAMGAAGDPHAGMGMGDPHAGMAMGDPHAGMAMGGQASPGGVDVTALGLEPPDPDRAIDPEKFLSGTIKPSAETTQRIPPGSVIFLSIKRADPATRQATGAPLAVKRLVVDRWPLWFRVTGEDAMISGTDFAGDVVITGWSDQDQDAISKQPGDVQGEVAATIPQKDLTLLLDSVVQ